MQSSALGAGTAAFLLLASLQARAATADHTALTECIGGATPRVRITACTQIITDADTTYTEVRALMQRGDAWYELGDYSAAESDYDSVIDLDPSFAEGYNGKGHAASQRGDADKALRAFDRLVHLRPRDAYAWIDRGTAWDSKGDLSRAIDDFTRAIQLDPNQELGFYDRCRARLLRSEPDLALEDCNRAVNLKPDDYMALTVRGDVHWAKGDHTRALADFQAALTIKPDYADAIEGVAMSRDSRDPGANDASRPKSRVAPNTAAR